MAGYDSYSMSNNARAAYDEGLTTYSKLRAWQKRAVDRGAVSPREWHHTSKTYNRTYFYDPADFAKLNPADFPPVKNDCAPIKEEPATFEWKEWGVINHHGKKGFRKHEPVDGVIRGDWFYYTEGLRERKKNIYGSHMTRLK